MRTPFESTPSKTLFVGEVFSTENSTPGRSAARRRLTTAAASIQGAPTQRNGRSVPRPTETLAASKQAIPG